MTTRNSHYQARFISNRSIRRGTLKSFEDHFRPLANGFFLSGRSLPLVAPPVLLDTPLSIFGLHVTRQTPTLHASYTVQSIFESSCMICLQCKIQYPQKNPTIVIATFWPSGARAQAPAQPPCAACLPACPSLPIVFGEPMYGGHYAGSPGCHRWQTGCKVSRLRVCL